MLDSESAWFFRQDLQPFARGGNRPVWERDNERGSGGQQDLHGGTAYLSKGPRRP